MNQRPNAEYDAGRVFNGATGEDITDEWNIAHGCNGTTLRHALVTLGLPVSGTKREQARRLVATGLTAAQVNERYGWRARQATTPTSPVGGHDGDEG